MPAIPVHHTATVDESWDGGAAERNLPDGDQAAWKKVYAWYDPQGADPDGDGLPDAKADWKFPHHARPGAAANLNACRNIKARVPQSNIPQGDEAGVNAHADSHLNDAPGASAFIAPRAYGHVTKAVFDRPWALEPAMLSFMAEVVRFRSAGGLVSEDDIRQRL